MLSARMLYARFSELFVAPVRFREECRADTIGGSCRPISRDQRERVASPSRASCRVYALRTVGFLIGENIRENRVRISPRFAIRQIHD